MGLVIPERGTLKLVCSVGCGIPGLAIKDLRGGGRLEALTRVMGAMGAMGAIGAMRLEIV